MQIINPRNVVLTVGLLVAAFAYDTATAKDRYSPEDYDGAMHATAYIAFSESTATIKSAIMEVMPILIRLHKVPYSDNSWTAHGLDSNGNPAVTYVWVAS